MNKKCFPTIIVFMLIFFFSWVGMAMAQFKPQQAQRPQPYTGGTQPTIQPQPIPSQTPTLSEPPKVTYFRINNDAASTSSRTVTLNNRTERASQYRASHRLDFYGAQWRSLIPAPLFTLDAGDGQKRVYFQVKNSMGQFSAVISDTITLSMVPTVTSFKVKSWGTKYNYGTNTSFLVVHTENVATNNPTQLRLSGDSNFSDTNWQAYRQTYDCYVGKGIGMRTVYFQVKNNYGTSNVRTATFDVPSRKIIKIDPATAWYYSQTYGFKFSCSPKDATSTCKMFDEEKRIIVLLSSGLLGSRCDYTLFGGRLLNEGWKFKSYQAFPWCSGNDRGFSVNERPNVDSRQIRFRVHLWNNPSIECRWGLSILNLEGPGDADWHEAFK